MPDAADARHFRDVIGRFATGVTVLTVAHNGEARGMTANAFTSVSLVPPLLLVCVGRQASLYPMFESTTTFAVNILTDDQQEISRYFAATGEKRETMGGDPYRAGRLGSPILDGVLAWAECRIEHRYAGGDHVIIVGHVDQLALEIPEAAPLVFYGGEYRSLLG